MKYFTSKVLLFILRLLGIIFWPRRPCPRARPRNHATQQARSEIFKLSLTVQYVKYHHASIPRISVHHFTLFHNVKLLEFHNMIVHYIVQHQFADDLLAGPGWQR